MTTFPPSRRPLAAAAVLLPLLAASACAGRYVTRAPVGQAGQPERAAEGAVTDHVVVVSIDGLRPDAIDVFDAETLQRLAEEGSHTFDARTILPSKTLPSHTSMLTGTEPDVHGITWNSDQVDEHGLVETPTIFATAHDRGFRTAAFFSKTKFRHLQVPGSLDYAQSPSRWPGTWYEGGTVDDVERYLEEARPNLLFVHIAQPDFAGHLVGWMSRPYGWAVQEADDDVARLLEVADEAFGEGNYTLIVTSDHGGHGRDHGTDDPRDVTIPWIAWGEGVREGRVLETDVRTVDTAATALWLLGVSPEDDVVGVPVVEAFTKAALASAGSS